MRSKRTPEQKKEANKEAQKKFRKKHPEKQKMWNKKWQDANPGINKEMQKRQYEREPAHVMVRHKRGEAKRRGILFGMTKEDISPLPALCPVLGIVLDYSYGNKGKHPADNSPSIDRLVPSKGYVAGNVRVISVRANRIKNDATLEEIRKVLQYLENSLLENTDCVVS